jgi:hypothetical protein
MTDVDDKLDYLKDRLYRGFGVEVRHDLQARAEIMSCASMPRIRRVRCPPA